ncbi:MAG: hypothetical protein AAGA85_19960 [Bacteroidota bacterium]
MNKLSSLLTFLFIVLLSVQTLYAQRNWDSKAMVAREKAMLYKKADGLTEDQKLLIDGIYDEYAVSMDEIIQEVRKTRNWREMRPKMTELRDEKTLLMEDLLNAEQYTVYADMMKQQDKQMEQRRQQRQQSQQQPQPPNPNQ